MTALNVKIIFIAFVCMSKYVYNFRDTTGKKRREKGQIKRSFKQRLLNTTENIWTIYKTTIKSEKTVSKM